MAKISPEQKLDNFRNMYGMIEDYYKQYGRHPTNQEFEEKLGMSGPTVRRYKAVIREQNKKKLLETFQYDIITHARASLETVNKNIKIFENIRDTAEDKDRVMTAAKNVLESHLDAIRIITDVPVYLESSSDQNNNNNVPVKQEHNIEESKEEQITDSIKSMYD